MSFLHQPVRRWWRSPVPDTARHLEAVGYPAWQAALLARRGVSRPQEAEAFLQPTLDDLHPAAELTGVTEAVERISEAREDGEKIAIVGDYDVDGISATALLSAVLRAAGIAVEIILPNRLAEGYGFQPVHVERARTAACSLVVTADCGSTAAEAVEVARGSGMDVIITDHHLPEGDRLPGVVEVNPKRQPGRYPFSDLAGAGVALKLATELAMHFELSIEVEALLRVACLGTICDLVPLVGENRTIAKLGLAELARTRSVGLQELIRRAQVRLPVSSADVGYRLGPRLNAAGRLASPDDALELLLTRDRRRAAELADRLDAWNRSRQEEETRVVDEALEALENRGSSPRILVAWGELWHPGVVGIAAGRIARQLNRPTILFSRDESWAKGSGRSIPGIHLFDFLSTWRPRYDRFGGHAQAVGLKVAVRDLEPLREAWERFAEETWDTDVLTKRLSYELEMSVRELDQELVSQLERLEPFGVGNPQPVLRVGPLSAATSPRLFGKGHLSLLARGRDGSSIDLVGWGWEARASELLGDFEVLGCLEQDSFTKRAVLRLVDARAWVGAELSDALTAPPHVE